MKENTYKICLRLTPQERAKLEADAKRCGLTKSALLRRMISGLEVKARPSQELRELRTEIHRIGNNINQIARSVNAGIATAEDARQALFLLRQVYQLMETVADRYGGH